MYSEQDNALNPAAKRQQEKAEYERRKKEDDEIKRLIEEEKANNRQSSYEEDVTSIPIDRLFAIKFNQKAKEMQTNMSKTMLAESQIN